MFTVTSSEFEILLMHYLIFDMVGSTREAIEPQGSCQNP